MMTITRKKMRTRVMRKPHYRELSVKIGLSSESVVDGVSFRLKTKAGQAGVGCRGSGKITTHFISQEEQICSVFTSQR